MSLLPTPTAAGRAAAPRSLCFLRSRLIIPSARAASASCIVDSAATSPETPNYPRRGIVVICLRSSPSPSKLHYYVIPQPLLRPTGSAGRSLLFFLNPDLPRYKLPASSVRQILACVSKRPQNLLWPAPGTRGRLPPEILRLPKNGLSPGVHLGPAWPLPGSFDSVSDCQLLSLPTSWAPNLKAGAANWGPEAVTSLHPPSNGNGPHIQHIDQI